MRPRAWQVAIAAAFAIACVWSFAVGRFDEQWISFWGLFLVIEVSGAASSWPGDTLSERWWSWAGVRPLRRGRVWRVPAALLFLFVLAAHFAQGGTWWWTGGGAVSVTSAPLAAAVLLGWRENRRRKA